MRRLIVNIVISLMALFAGFQLHQSIYPESGKPRVDSGLSVQKDEVGSQDKSTDPAAVHFSTYKAVGEKSLFRPERREWIPPRQAEDSKGKKAEENKPKTPPPRLTLYGTIIYGDDVKIAIIKEGSGGGATGEKRESYRLGDEISGYSVQEIGEDKVILAKGEDIIELKLREGKSLPGAPVVRREQPAKGRRAASKPGVRASTGKAKSGEEPEQIVVKGPGGQNIVKRKKVIRTPFGPKTIYIQER